MAEFDVVYQSDILERKSKYFLLEEVKSKFKRGVPLDIFDRTVILKLINEALE